MLGLTLEELAKASSVSDRTIMNFENELRSPHEGTLKLLRIAFEEAGITFLPDEGQGEGLRLKKK